MFAGTAAVHEGEAAEVPSDMFAGSGLKHGGLANVAADKLNAAVDKVQEVVVGAMVKTGEAVTEAVKSILPGQN